MVVFANLYASTIEGVEYLWILSRIRMAASSVAEAAGAGSMDTLDSTDDLELPRPVIADHGDHDLQELDLVGPKPVTRKKKVVIFLQLLS